MANPQPNEFTKISNELYAAIMQSDFSKRQRNIIDLVIRMSYGCGKKGAFLDNSDYELVGVHKSDIKKELEYLGRTKVLIFSNGITYLNKNYDQWRIGLLKSINFEKWEKVLHRNLVGKIPTEQIKLVGKIPTEQIKLVGKIPTDTPLKPLGDMGLPSPKEIDLKEIDLKERNNPIDLLIDDQPENLEDVADVADVVFDFLDKFDEIRMRITGSPFPSPHDIEAEKLILSVLPFAEAKAVVEVAVKEFKPKYPGHKIRGMAYFVPIIQEAVAAKKAKNDLTFIPADQSVIERLEFEIQEKYGDINFDDYPGGHNCECGGHGFINTDGQGNRKPRDFIPIAEDPYKFACQCPCGMVKKLKLLKGG